MKEIKYSKEASLVNLSNSFLKYYGITPFHPTLSNLDEILNKKQYKKVAVLLFDGLGKYIKQEVLSEKDFLNKKEKMVITSIFPPTTVAATTAFLTAKYPIENGWLGWDQHFNDLNVTVDMFSNIISKTTQKYPRDISYEYCPYQDILELISKRVKTFYIKPERLGGEVKNTNHLFEVLDSKFKNNDEFFLYMYYPEPDHTIHETGVHSYQSKEIIKYINKHVAKLAKNNPDTLLIVIADHGLIDVTYDKIEEHEDLYELLKFPPSLDTRSIIFHVKDNKQDEFRTLFNKYYGEYYRLLTTQEVIDQDYFGLGNKHPQFYNFLGDFMATSISSHAMAIKNDDNTYTMFLGAHSGSLEEEYLISVAVIND